MPLRVMVVGLGFGYTFAKILRDHPDYDLAGVADLNEDTAARVATELGLSRAARTLDDALLMPDVDAVALFTHAPRHAEHSVRALRAGKHVLCAVPAAISLEQCEQLLEAVR